MLDDWTGTRAIASFIVKPSSLSHRHHKDDPQTSSLPKTKSAEHLWEGPGTKNKTCLYSEARAFIDDNKENGATKFRISREICLR